jgi:anti-anti-sigma factor
MIDETCRIGPTGVELARVALGELAADRDLSPDESRNPFFLATMALPAGEIHVHTPYVSPDTHRWVLSVSTPLYSDTTNYGMLHFEVPLAYYHQLLKSSLPPDTFFAIAGSSGDLYVNSAAPAPADQPLPDLGTLSGDAGLHAMTPDLLAGKTGIATWRVGGLERRVRYERIEPAPGLSLILLIGLPIVPNFLSQFQAFLLPLALGALFVLVVVSISAQLLDQPPDMQPPQTATRQVKSIWRVPRRIVVMFALLAALMIASSVAVLAPGAIEEGQIADRMNRLARLVHDLRQQQEAIAGGEATAAAQSIQDIHPQLEQALAELAQLDAGGNTAQRIGGAVRHYQADVDELLALMAQGRSAEARNWRAERVDQSYAQLISLTADPDAIAGEIAHQTERASGVVIMVMMVMPVILSGLLFWRFQRVRTEDLLDAAEQRRATDLRVAEERRAAELLEAEQRRAAELQQTLADLHRSIDTRDQLQAAVQALACPVVPILDGVLVMPLIGAIDTERVDQLMQTLLTAVEQRRARFVILDVTGVPLIDTQVARGLLRASASVRLLGAQTVLVGVRPEMAQTLVELGLSFGGLVPHADLQQGFNYVLRQLEVARDRGSKVEAVLPAGP